MSGDVPGNPRHRRLFHRRYIPDESGSSTASLVVEVERPLFVFDLRAGSTRSAHCSVGFRSHGNSRSLATNARDKHASGFPVPSPRCTVPSSADVPPKWNDMCTYHCSANDYNNEYIEHLKHIDHDSTGPPDPMRSCLHNLGRQRIGVPSKRCTEEYGPSTLPLGVDLGRAAYPRNFRGNRSTAPPNWNKGHRHVRNGGRPSRSRFGQV